MHLLKECLQMEAICRKLALREPHNKEQWRAKARVWHQRAGRYVTDAFDDVAVPAQKQENETTEDPV